MRTLRAPALLLLVSTLLAGTHLTCKKKPTEPPNGGPDTTSHNWTFTTDSIGEFGSYLRDIAFLDDGTAWAVGRLSLRDSNGQLDPTAFNLLKWNGGAWTYARVMFPVCDSNGNEIGTFPFQCTAIFAFGPNDILLTSGGNFAHWNGSVFQRYCLPPGLIQGEIMKMWGTSTTRFFAVGRNGTVIMGNGTTWQRLESNTTVDLLDVWGSPDGSVVWACGYKDFVGTVLLKITGTTVEKVYDDLDTWFRIRQDSLSGVLTSVWTNRPDRIFVSSSSGVYQCEATTGGEGTRMWYNDTYAPGLPRRMRGNSQVDLLASGEFASVYHFNGDTWRYYTELHNASTRWWSLALRSNKAVFVGAENQTQRGLVMWASRR